MTHICNVCGLPIIFRASRVNPKTGRVERPRRARVYAIHLHGHCGQMGLPFD